MLSIYMSNGKNHYLIKQIMKLMNCDFKSLYVYMFSLFKGKSGDFWFFFFNPEVYSILCCAWHVDYVACIFIFVHIQ